MADAARPAWAGGPGGDGEDAATQRGADEDATDEGAVGHPAADPGPESTAAGVRAGAGAARAQSAGPAESGPESAGAGGAGAAGQAAAGPAASAGAAAAGLAAGAGAAGALAAGAAAAAASGLSPPGARDADQSAGPGRAAGSGPSVDRSATRVPGQDSAPAPDAATDPAGDRSATQVAGGGDPASASLDPADRYATRAPGQAGPGQAAHAAAALAGGGDAGPATVTNVPGAGAPGAGAAPAGQPGGASPYPGAAAAGAAGAAGLAGAGLAGAGLAGAGLAGAGLAGAGLGGAGAAGHDPRLDLASSPAAAVAAARLNQTQPMPIVRDPSHGSLSDLLPDVQYGPAASGRRRGPPGGPYDPNATGVIGGPYDPQAGPNRAAQYGLAQPAPARGQRLFVLLVVLAGAGIAVLLPVAGGAIALTALLALRGGDLTRNWAARRRAKRGTAAAMSALVYPGMLVWSWVTMIALAPVALVAAGIAVTLTILVVPAHPFVQAAAYAAGAIVLCYGLGPGSSAPRRQLGRIYAAMARSPGATAVILFFTGTLCLAALVAAFSQLPFYWPLEHLRVRIDHWQPLRDLAHTLRTSLMSWYHQIFS